jgi:hypothetical protein
MFQLYKSRTFGEYISETFDFLRADGKHFFTQFFTILGVPVLIMAFSLYYGMKFYFNFILSTSFNGGNMEELQALASNNLPLFIILILLFFIVTMVLSMMMYSFPVLYLKLYTEKRGSNFETKDILNEFKNNFGRILIYFILMFFTMLIIMFIIIIPLIISIITIIGPFIIIAAIYLFNILSLYIYLNNPEMGFMDSISTCFEQIKKNFWPTIGAVAIMYLITSIVSGIFSMIGGGINMAEMMTTLQNNSIPEEEEFGIKTILEATLTTLAYVVQYTLMNLPLLTGGLIYYSMQENNENFNVKSEIDLIGIKDVE